MFSHGQLYVACSRVSDPKDLSIYLDKTDKQHGFQGSFAYTKNDVYQTLLQEEIRKFKLSKYYQDGPSEFAEGMKQNLSLVELAFSWDNEHCEDFGGNYEMLSEPLTAEDGVNLISFTDDSDSEESDVQMKDEINMSDIEEMNYELHSCYDLPNEGPIHMIDPEGKCLIYPDDADDEKQAEESTDEE